MVHLYVYGLLSSNKRAVDIKFSHDYIIAGQGLAGSCLALQLVGRGKRIMVLDTPEQNHASAVAAGLFNPFTGKVMARTWMADTLFPSLFAFYQDAEVLLGQKFFFPREIYRPFLSVQEQNGWMGKSADPGFGSYISTIFTRAAVANVQDPFGGLLLKQSGYLDVPVFLRSVREYMFGLDAWRSGKIETGNLEVHDEYVRYGDLTAKAIIFCEGMNVSGNPYFSWLPINPLKGETMTVTMEPLPYIINRGVYVVGQQNGREFTIGATYDFTRQDPGISPEGLADLSGKLDALVNMPYVVTAQNWGIRPTTLDQKIMIGSHPKWRNVLILNGLGTKGVSQAPYFSAQLAGWLEGKNDILREVNIQRYNALYSKSV